MQIITVKNDIVMRIVPDVTYEYIVQVDLVVMPMPGETNIYCEDDTVVQLGQPFEITPEIQLQSEKIRKAAQLNVKCNRLILAGFTSDALGQPYTYDYDYKDQINLAGVLNAINAGLISGPITLKTREVGEVQHSITQFRQVYMDSLVHKDSHIAQYNTLKAQVQNCQTIEEVKAIEWPE